MQTAFAIAGMTCDKCRSKVEQALTVITPTVVVTREPGQAVLTTEGPVSLAAVQSAVSAVGNYAASLLTTDAARTPSPQQTGTARTTDTSWLATYYPLLLIAGYISLCALAGGGSTSATVWMSNFMAGFFLVFSAFKFLDLRGFADAYASYDILAKRWPAYGLIYPFLELGLGLAFLFNWAPTITNLATLVLMSFSSIGVITALRDGRKIRCACLGTVLNLPMSTVTIVEDLLMAAMAAWMLLAGHVL
jgi:copper chaperone CopZ